MALYRRVRSTRLLMVALVAASLLTITVDFRQGSSGPLAVAGRAVRGVISPLQRGVSAVIRPVRDFFSTVGHLGSLRSENERLTAELESVLTNQGTVLSLQFRVRELEKLLGIKESIERPTRVANVIAEGVSNFEWIVTVDAGSSQGVQRNDPVVAPDGLVGHVVAVSAGSSDVQLIRDPDSAVAARLSGSRDTGLLEGDRDQDLRMELVDTTAEVAPGEPVETSGYQGGLYPAGIPIGTVSRVLNDPSALSKQIWVRPNVDFSKLETVLIILR